MRNSSATVKFIAAAVATVLVTLSPCHLVTLSSCRAGNVKYFDRAAGKEVELKDVPVDEDGPRGITLKPRGGKPVAVSALDVREFAYGANEVQPVDYLSYRKPFAKLDRADQPDTKDEQKPELYRQALADF